jgi:hypothetical protein
MQTARRGGAGEPERSTGGDAFVEAEVVERDLVAAEVRLEHGEVALERDRRGSSSEMRQRESPRPIRGRSDQPTRPGA